MDQPVIDYGVPAKGSCETQRVCAWPRGWLRQHGWREWEGGEIAVVQQSASAEDAAAACSAERHGRPKESLEEEAQERASVSSSIVECRNYAALLP